MLEKNSNIVGLIISLISVTLICYFFQPIYVLYILILFGLGHIYIAFYSLLKSKKTKKEIKILTPIAFIIFFTLAYYIFENYEYAKIYILLSFLYFTMHFYYDEVKMNFKEISLKHLPGLVALISIFTSVYISQYYYSFDYSLKMLIYYIGLVSFAIYTIILSLEIKEKNGYSHVIAHSIFFYSMFLLALFFYLSREHISYYYLAGFVVIFHYIRWYIYYYFLTKNFSHESCKKYLITVFVFNLGFIALSVLPFEKNNFVYLFFFHPLYFYALANAHVTVSFYSEFLGKK